MLVSASTAPLVDARAARPRRAPLQGPRRARARLPARDGDFPPLKSLYRTNLPVPATPFLGRERELAEVVELLARWTPACSRSPARAARARRGSPTGGRRGLATASPTASSGCRWRRCATRRSSPTRWRRRSRSRSGRVRRSPTRSSAHRREAGAPLLDNCEHLLDAVAELVPMLVDACPDLVCSGHEPGAPRPARRAAFSVPPMAASDGEALFVERARAVAGRLRADEHVAGDLRSRRRAAPGHRARGRPRAVSLPQRSCERLGERFRS